MISQAVRPSVAKANDSGQRLDHWVPTMKANAAQPDFEHDTFLHNRCMMITTNILCLPINAKHNRQAHQRCHRCELSAVEDGEAARPHTAR